VNAWLDKKEDAARKAGDKLLVDQVKLARQLYEDSGRPPVIPPPDVLKLPTSAQKEYDAAMVAATKEYLLAKKDDEVAKVAQQLKEFREEIDPRAPFKKALAGTWSVSVAKHSAEWTFKEDGTVTSTEGAIKEGRWGVDLNHGVILIVWSKDYVDKFDLPLDPAKTLGSQVGRGNAKIEAVKKP
jgi:hypothetical protein